jgi:hypothetical protein
MRKSSIADRWKILEFSKIDSSKKPQIKHKRIAIKGKTEFLIKKIPLSIFLVNSIGSIHLQSASRIFAPGKIHKSIK